MKKDTRRLAGFSIFAFRELPVRWRGLALALALPCWGSGCGEVKPYRDGVPVPVVCAPCAAPDPRGGWRAARDQKANALWLNDRLTATVYTDQLNEQHGIELRAYNFASWRREKAHAPLSAHASFAVDRRACSKRIPRIQNGREKPLGH